MNIIVEKDYEQLSKTTMQLLLGYMYKTGPVDIAITAGSTPIRLYELLIEELKQKDNSFLNNITFYNFDEIPLKGKEGYGVTMNNLNKMFFEPAKISDKNIHVLDEKNYSQHDQYLKSKGGLDVILLGLGADGHFCGNLPHTTKFSDGTTTVDIDSRPDMREIIKDEVGGDENLIPEFYVTMGPKSVMHAKKVIMFASGIKKAEAVKNAFFGEVTEEWPSSIFQMHPDFTLILDEEAASLLNK